jgi:hypothetical protein
MLAIVIDWSGPFQSVDVAKKIAAEFELGEVLYLATGQRLYQRQDSLQYVGLSSNLKNRFNDPTHKISTDVNKNLKIWVGEIVSHARAGRRLSRHPVAHSVGVELAEWMLAYFLALHLNVKKRKKTPRESAVLLNRWFKSDFETRRRQRPHPEWPDFMDYDTDYQSASLVWFGAPPRRRTFSSAEIRNLALTS